MRGISKKLVRKVLEITGNLATEEDSGVVNDGDEEKEREEITARVVFSICEITFQSDAPLRERHSEKLFHKLRRQPVP